MTLKCPSEFANSEATVLPRSAKATFSTMAASNLAGVLSRLRNKCLNCALFDWEQSDHATLRQCGKCKVVQYCGEQCQKENWMMVHKQQCMLLASVKADGSNGLPALRAPDDALMKMKIQLMM